MGHLRDVLHKAVLAADGHVPVAHDRGHVLDLAALGLPFRKTAIQHGNIGLAHQPEGPPDAGGGKQARAVIDHDLMAVAHAHGAHPADEFFRGRGHMRQGGPVVRNLVDVEEARAGIWAASYSARASRPASGMYHEASITRRSGSRRCAASQSVETSVRGSSR
jgi:hypothetical protein